MKYSDLTNLFWDAINEIVGNEVSGEPDRYIRWKYPAKGGPDWGFDNNIVFLNLSEMDDEYGKQNDSIYVTEMIRLLGNGDERECGSCSARYTDRNPMI